MNIPKEKKELQAQIDLLSSQLEELEPVVVKQRKERDERYTKIINELKSQITAIEKKEATLNREIMEINEVLYSPDEAKIKSLAEKCKEYTPEVQEEV